MPPTYQTDSIDYYAQQARRFPLLTREQEIELAREIQKGSKKALEQFVSSNLRLVLKLATKMIRKNSTVSILDIVQDGNMGLMIAAQRFDPERGFKFSTYACWWVKQALSRSIMYGDLIHLPVYVQDQRHKIKLAQRAFWVEHNRQATVDELADWTGVSKIWVARILDLPDTLSLEDPIGDDGESTLGSMLVDQTSENAELIQFLSEQQDGIDKLLAALNDKEQLVIGLRFFEGLSLEGVSQQMDLTRERIRQIELKALRKMKSCCAGLAWQLHGSV